MGAHREHRNPTAWVALWVALAVVVVGGAGVAVPWRLGAFQSAARAGVGSGGDPAPAVTVPPPPLTVTSVTPADGSTGVAATSAVEVDFSAPLATGTPTPTLTPNVPGTWQRSGATTLSFTPEVAFVPSSPVTVAIPAGVRAADGATLATGLSDHFTVAAGSVLRLQELLAELDYLPLAFTPAGAEPAPTDAAGQGQAAFNPPAGTFAWRQSGWPASLASFWQAGSDNLVTKGAVMAFEADNGLATDGSAGPGVWQAALAALAGGKANTGGYNYAVASKATPETLTIWHDGNQVFQSPANTGISQAPTASGTFPVYSRLRNQVMQGSNPDGSHYADPVQYVAYFNGGDAVHYIPRNDYGSPASLGCVELPLAQAAQAWPLLSIGTLVTVT